MNEYLRTTIKPISKNSILDQLENKTCITFVILNFTTIRSVVVVVLYGNLTKMS